jgi:hypothetical protein
MIVHIYRSCALFIYERTFCLRIVLYIFEKLLKTLKEDNAHSCMRACCFSENDNRYRPNSIDGELLIEYCQKTTLFPDNSRRRF